MNETELKQLSGLWAMYSAYYRSKLDDQVLIMYANDLEDLDFTLVKNALDQYRRNPKNKTLPLPAQIREIIQPEIDSDSLAKEIASRITGAISKFGWSNSGSAREFIGEDGWAVVERSGGWMYLCENHGITIDHGTFQAQSRDLLKARLIHSPQALDDKVRLTNGATSTKLVELLESTIKVIE